MRRQEPKEKTVYVAMSGGVDSSVAALLLKKQGFRVVGVFMMPWQTPGVTCMWQADRQDALRVAAKLDIPLLTWDFSREYGQRVAKKMVDSYRRGVTPNPDVDCNKEIKFGLFYRRAIKEGADYVATGHYARIIRHAGRSWMAKAKDSNKDQTYFLWAIKPECLERTLFPIGDLPKPEVRALAARAGLITATKKDSQGVCFVGDMNVKDFLASKIKSRPGKILHTDGRQLGTHDGSAFYTIGQRHGLDIKDGGGPYFVIRKDIRHNTITVGTERDLLGKSAKLTKTQWFGPRPSASQKVSVKIRYRTPGYWAVINAKGEVVFARSVRAITPGQSAVIYQGSRVLGGGIIK